MANWNKFFFFLLSRFFFSFLLDSASLVAILNAYYNDDDEEDKNENKDNDGRISVSTFRSIFMYISRMFGINEFPKQCF